MFEIRFNFDKDHYLSEFIETTEPYIWLLINEAKEKGFYSFKDRKTGQVNIIYFDKVKYISLIPQ